MEEPSKNVSGLNNRDQIEDQIEEGIFVDVGSSSEGQRNNPIPKRILVSKTRPKRDLPHDPLPNSFPVGPCPTPTYTFPNLKEKSQRSKT